MKILAGLIMIAALNGCAVCKSSDNAEQCRTKQRDHSQSLTSLSSNARPAPERR